MTKTETQKIVVGKVIADFIKEFKKGFRGVRFVEIYDETQQETYEDEQTKEQYDEWFSNYGIFVAQPEFEMSLSDDSDNEYDTHEIDVFKFEQDFKDELQKRLGDDVKITNTGNYEFECQRVPGYSYAESIKPKTPKFEGIPYSVIQAACADLHYHYENDHFKDDVSVPESFVEFAKYTKSKNPDPNLLRYRISALAVKILSTSGRMLY